MGSLLDRVGFEGSIVDVCLWVVRGPSPAIPERRRVSVKL